jgi:diaminohydroxyphosphoribosylaminopyrimidine deaminase/5-amino-6-(5-phosphoribosylamino)uracil reductase
MMRRALHLAARGRTSPNPQVGAVVFADGQIVGEGYHHRCGEPHAEVHALAAAGEQARGADLYVTLEPCDHQGRTPPCTRAILAAEIRRVFVGHLDPDSKVAGRGLGHLREAGLEVTVGVEGERCDRFYRAYDTHRTQGRPQVILKAGMTLDGRVATRTGHSRWITGPEARRMVHRLRHRVDAIMVGIGTVLADDPELTTRLPRGAGHDPIRIIVDSRGRTPPESKVILHTSQAPTILAHTAAGAQSATALARSGVELLECHAREGRVDLRDLLRRLAERGIVSLLAEGGGELHWSLLEANLADQVMLFVAPVMVGGRASLPVVGGAGVARMPEAFAVTDWKIQRVGQDFLFQGRVRAGIR